MAFQIVTVNYHDPQQAKDLVFLLNHYALADSGGGEGLPDDVKSQLVPRLAQIPHAFSLIVYAAQQPVGLVNAFHGFSTFKARPLINIHDLVVHAEFRRQGVSQLLLAEVEKIALHYHCCKVTLEVLDQNFPALNAYQKFGFKSYGLNPAYGKAIFLEKYLT